MDYLKAYLDAVCLRGNEQLADSISCTAEYLGENYIKNFSFLNDEVGLLFGNIQSGKTSQLFGIICKAADLGFSSFLMLTTDNNL